MLGGRAGELKEFGFWELLEKHDTGLNDLEGASKDVTSKDVTSKDVTSRDATSKNATSKNATSTNGTSTDHTSKDTTVADATSTDAACDDAASKSGASELGTSKGAAPSDQDGLEEKRPTSSTFSWLWKGRAASMQVSSRFQTPDPVFKPQMPLGPELQRRGDEWERLMTEYMGPRSTPSLLYY